MTVDEMESMNAGIRWEESPPPKKHALADGPVYPVLIFMGGMGRRQPSSPLHDEGLGGHEVG